MNKPSNHRPQVRRVAREANPEFAEDYEEDDYQEDEVEAEEAYAPPPGTQRRRDREQRKAAPGRDESYGSDRDYRDGGYSGGRKGRDRSYGGDTRSRRNVPARRDPFPLLIGAMIGAGLIGLMAIVFLLTVKPNGATTASTNTTNPSSSSSSTTPNPANSGNSGSAGQSSSGAPPPRMPVGDFKKLYDDPAKRPLIIDVRAKDVYDQGHIKGAESWPESDIDSRVVKLPKDKLIVAYCQWPAENESARVAQKLHDTYGFSYDDKNGKPLLRVLLGGWNTWKQENAKDPNAYPIETTSGATPGAGGEKPVISVPGTVQIKLQPTAKP